MNKTTLKSHGDAFPASLSSQVGQGAMDAVKSLVATEGQSRSVMKEITQPFHHCRQEEKEGTFLWSISSKKHSNTDIP